MSEPASGGVSAPSKPDNRKPTKALPTDRVSVDRQLMVLRAYGAIAVDSGVSGAAVAEVVEIHPSSVSVCNPFLFESGLIERSGSGYKAAPATVSYRGAFDWDQASAGAKLAAPLRETWFWKAMAPRLSFRAMGEEEAVRVLAEECGAPKSYEGQIKGILDYLETASLIVRDGGTIRRGPQATPDAPIVPPPPPPAGEIDEKKGTPPPPGDYGKGASPGIAFEASIQISMEEVGRWSPEQIKAFFAGLAEVIAAKGNAAG